MAAGLLSDTVLLHAVSTSMAATESKDSVLYKSPDLTMLDLVFQLYYYGL